MDKIAKIVYINLDSRTDRRQEIEKELATYNLSAERFEAIKGNPGFIGCSKSHLAVLKKAQQENLPNILILEDDFEFLVSKATLDDQLSMFWDLNLDWDVVMLSYNLLDEIPFDNELIGRVKDVQTASGYLVNNKFYQALIDVLEPSIPLLESTHRNWLYACDVVWKKLQPVSNWFYFRKRVGKQRASYSDNEKKYTDYGV